MTNMNIKELEFDLVCDLLIDLLKTGIIDDNYVKKLSNLPKTRSSTQLILHHIKLKSETPLISETPKVEFKGFHQVLVDAIDSQSKYHYLMKYAPDLFTLLCDILSDKRTDWHTKIIINASLSYFVIPEDVIHDKEDDGYLDDLFIISYALDHIIRKVDPNLVLENWKKDENIVEIVQTIHDETKIIIGGENYLKILRLVGLKKVESLDLAHYENTNSKRVAKITDEKNELLGLLSFITTKLYNAPRFRNTPQIIEFLKNHEDYHEIERFMELAKGDKKVVTSSELSQDAKFELNLRNFKIKELLGR
jgi:uncharacterized membrane protein YkvA (DUF1232 family)